MLADFLNTTFYHFDTSVYHLVGGWQTETLNDVFHFITFFGSGTFSYLLAAVLLVLLVPKKTRKYAAVVLSAIVIGTLITNVTLKPLIARPRPYVGMLTTPFAEEYLGYYHFAGRVVESDYSFPSGHTTFAFEVVTALVTTMIRDHKHWAYWLIPVPFLVALSRIYLMVHYPTDVIGGVVVGILAGVAGAFFGTWLLPRAEQLLQRRKNKA